MESREASTGAGVGRFCTSLKSDRGEDLPKAPWRTRPAAQQQQLGSASWNLRRACGEPLADPARRSTPPSPPTAHEAPPLEWRAGQRRRERGWAEPAAAGDSAGAATPPRAPLRPPLRVRVFRARAAPRLAPPPPAARVRARRCGFFSGVRGAPLLAPELAGTRLLSASFPSARRQPAAKTPQAAHPVSKPGCWGGGPRTPALEDSGRQPQRRHRLTPEPRVAGEDVPVPWIGSLSSVAGAIHPPACPGAREIPEVSVSSPLLKSGVLDTLACLFLPLTARPRGPEASSRSRYYAWPWPFPKEYIKCLPDLQTTFRAPLELNSILSPLGRSISEG